MERPLSREPLEERLIFFLKEKIFSGSWEFGHKYRPFNMYRVWLDSYGWWTFFTTTCNSDLRDLSVGPLTRRFFEKWYVMTMTTLFYDCLTMNILYVMTKWVFYTLYTFKYAIYTSEKMPYGGVGRFGARNRKLSFTISIAIDVWFFFFSVFAYNQYFKSGYIWVLDCASCTEPTVTAGKTPVTVPNNTVDSTTNKCRPYTCAVESVLLVTTVRSLCSEFNLKVLRKKFFLKIQMFRMVRWK